MAKRTRGKQRPRQRQHRRQFFKRQSTRLLQSIEFLIRIRLTPWRINPRNLNNPLPCTYQEVITYLEGLTIIPTTIDERLSPLLHDGYTDGERTELEDLDSTES